MPPLLPVPGVARVVCNGISSITGNVWINVFHVGRVSPGGAFLQTDVDAIAAAVRGGWAAQFAPLQASSITLTEVQATDLTNSFGLVGTASGSTLGGIGTGFMPPQCAIGISWSQSQHYRGGHPRTYLPAPVNAQLQASGSNLLSPAAATSYDTAAENFRTAVSAAATFTPVQLVLVRRIGNKAVLDPPLVNPILGSTVDRRLDTQRRRLGPDIA